MKKNAHADTPGLVELQLLRHGPPHNQLLSPLTDYLALCGNHPNTTLRIPLEHSALETRLRALNYGDSEQTRIDQLRETARIASELLAKVPGLIADLSADRGEGAPFVHLSIVSRASELALFPFELAVSPDGLPGAGQALVLQKQMPVCLTRRSPNIRNDDFVWDRPVKILLAASDIGGEIPIVQHFALLRKLVEPWVGTMPDDDEGTKSKVQRVLRLVTQASVELIAQTLSEEVDRTGEPFTHIHVLAHGCDLPDTDRRSGIALHHSSRTGEMDAVDGKRLALTLGCLPDYPEEAKRYQGPAVVTLATCASADQGGVKIPGASLAFELHDSGIPLVVGSQFPLTQEGSIIMTEALYTGFLAGGDPRSTIWETRRALLANLSQKPGKCDSIPRSAHDWASLTVYAALPKNLDEILPAHWSKRNQRRLDVRLKNIHRLMSPEAQPGPKDFAELWWQAADKAAEEAKIFGMWTQTLEGVDETTRVSNSGILASAQKQIGLLWLRAAITMDPTIITFPVDEDPADWAEAGEKWLRESRAEYRRIFEFAREKTWALVQFLVLDFVLRADDAPAEWTTAEWTTARQLALIDQHAADPLRCVDALAALVELEFLRWLQADFRGDPLAVGDTTKELAQRIHGLYREKRDARGGVLSAIRQFQRYLDDFAELAFFAWRNPDVADFKERLKNRQEERKKRKPQGPGYPTLPSPRPKVRADMPGKAIAAIKEIMNIFADID